MRKEAKLIKLHWLSFYYLPALYKVLILTVVLEVVTYINTETLLLGFSFCMFVRYVCLCVHVRRQGKGK